MHKDNTKSIESQLIRQMHKDQSYVLIIIDQINALK